MAAGDVRVGTSGWRYPSWRGAFYPQGLPRRAELAYAASRMRTVEINGSFYSLQRPSSYRLWYRETPSDFVFGVKGGQFITHAKKLRDCRQPLANFFASGVLALEEKLGPILWQLPPQLPFDAERIDRFFELLPRTSTAAAALAAEHDARVKHGAHLEVRQDRPLKYAIEVRHESFHQPAFVRLLRRHRVALCIADTPERSPYFEDVTADHVYVRLHGETERYVSGYEPASLDAWARRIEQWRLGLERIRQPREVVSDRYCSIFRKAISIGRRRCLYLRRWTSRTSSGRRFERASQSPSARARRDGAGVHGETRAMCSTGFFGSFAPERRGRTCRGGTRRTRPATIAFRSGSGRACSIGC